MARTLIMNPNGLLVFEDQANRELLYLANGGGPGPQPPADCTICDDTCLDTYYIDVNMSSGTCVNACTTLNVTNQAVTKVGEACQWTWVNGDYTYELTCDADDSKWHARIWYGGIGNTLCADWVQVSETVFTCPPLGNDLDGTWVRESGACFGSFGLSCANCSDPVVLLSVFDADYAGGDILWCGQTWTQAEVQAGASKCVCPTTYNIKHYSAPSGSWEEFWVYSDSLRMYRQYTSFGFGFTARNGLQIYPQSTAFKDRVVFNGPPTSSSVVYSTLNKILGVGLPTSTGYRITDAFFGSYTSFGIQYTWSRGGGW